jgi:CRP/FNR family transcriptional activator FtrB
MDTQSSSAGKNSADLIFIKKTRRAPAYIGPMGDVGTVELGAVRLFAQVPQGRLQEIATAAQQRHVPGRAVVLEEEDRPDTLHIVLEGAVELFSRFDDQETTLEVVESGAALLLGSTLTGLPYIASARTLVPSRIVTIPATAVRALFDADKAFARAVAAELARASYRLLLELKSQKLRTCMERLAEWLLRADAKLGGNGQFRLPFGKRVLASRLGMTPENLSRSLRSLADRGVMVRGRNVTLGNPAALAALARGWAPPAAELDF